MLEINIRESKIEDCREISRIRRMKGVTENILSTPRENEEEIKKRFLNRTENDYWYVAELDGEVVGVSTLNRYSNPRKNHVGDISVIVDSNYQSKGIGKILMDELINLSDNILQLKRLELIVFIDNEKAINLYKKYEFEVEGVQKYFALKEEKYTDVLMMARLNLFV